MMRKNTDHAVQADPGRAGSGAPGTPRRRARRAGSGRSAGTCTRSPGCTSGSRRSRNVCAHSGRRPVNSAANHPITRTKKRRDEEEVQDDELRDGQDDAEGHRDPALRRGAGVPHARPAWSASAIDAFVMSPPFVRRPSRGGGFTLRTLEHRQPRGADSRRRHRQRTRRRQAGRRAPADRTSARPDSDVADAVRTTAYSGVDERPVARALPTGDDVVHDVAERDPTVRDRRTRRRPPCRSGRSSRGWGRTGAAAPSGLKPRPNVTSSCRIGQ